MGEHYFQRSEPYVFWDKIDGPYLTVSTQDSTITFPLSTRYPFDIVGRSNRDNGDQVRGESTYLRPRNLIANELCLPAWNRNASKFEWIVSLECLIPILLAQRCLIVFPLSGEFGPIPSMKKGLIPAADPMSHEFPWMRMWEKLNILCAYLL